MSRPWPERDLDPSPEVNDRILIVAPSGRDAELARAALQAAGISAQIVNDIQHLCDELERGAGAAMITDEALDMAGMECLRDALERQPPWSDFPLLIFTS